MKKKKTELLANKNNIATLKKDNFEWLSNLRFLSLKENKLHTNW